jgi:hypothetical protein
MSIFERWQEDTYRQMLCKVNQHHSTTLILSCGSVEATGGNSSLTAALDEIMHAA